MVQEVNDLGPVKDILREYAKERGALIPVLQKAQAVYGWLPKGVLEAIAEGMNMPLSQVYGVATFYSQFYLSRRGRHIVRQCDGTACHVRGASRIMDSVQKHLGIEAGQTTPDYRVTYEVVYCLGSCGLSPVAMVDDRVVSHLVPGTALEILDGLE